MQIRLMKNLMLQICVQFSDKSFTVSMILNSGVIIVILEGWVEISNLSGIVIYQGQIATVLNSICREVSKDVWIYKIENQSYMNILWVHLLSSVIFLVGRGEGNNILGKTESNI